MISCSSTLGPFKISCQDCFLPFSKGQDMERKSTLWPLCLHCLPLPRETSLFSLLSCTCLPAVCVPWAEFKSLPVCSQETTDQCSIWCTLPIPFLQHPSGTNISFVASGNSFSASIHCWAFLSFFFFLGGGGWMTNSNSENTLGVYVKYAEEEQRTGWTAEDMKQEEGLYTQLFFSLKLF